MTRWSRWLPTMGAAAVWVPGIGMACSGPGAMRTILRNERIGWILCAATLLIACVFAAIPRLRARGWKKQWPFLLLAVLHPGWWMSARSGDCGFTLVEGSILMTAATLLVGSIIYWKVRRSSSRVAA